MRIPSDDPSPVVDIDNLAKLTIGAGEDHRARRGVVDRRFEWGGEVEPRMHGAAAVGRVTPNAEATLKLGMDQLRRGRQRLKRPLQAPGGGVAGNPPARRFSP